MSFHSVPLFDSVPVSLCPLLYRGFKINVVSFVYFYFVTNTCALGIISKKSLLIQCFTLVFFFSTQQMHPFALLYILFIVSNNYLFIKVYFHRILTIHSPSDGNLYLLSPKQLCIFKTHSADPAIHVGGLDLAFRRPICLKPDTNLLLNTWNFFEFQKNKVKKRKNNESIYRVLSSIQTLVSTCAQDDTLARENS